MKPTNQILPIKSICILIFIFQSSLVISQNRSFATLPLAQSGKLIINATGDLNHTADYKRISTIYNNLVNARGDFRSPVPPLFLKDEEGYVAYIDYNLNEITLEKKAYDVCKKHGDNAIAFLLAHELTHYYEKHAWRNSFVRQNSDLDIGQNLKTIQDGILNETEADYLGGFLAYTAGYGLFADAGKVISDLYAAYGLQENLPGYPSKSDRIELCDRSAKNLEQLVDAFEMGNMLYAADMKSEAYRYYQYVLNHYPSRELYNNQGTIAVLSAMELMDKSELKYKYVTVLDLNFEGSKDASKSVTQQISDFLDQAIIHFNSAINLDPSYAPAYLNKANAYALKKQWKKADFYLNQEALPIAQSSNGKYDKTILDIEVLNGIILAEKGMTNEAEAVFIKAAQNNSEIAKINLAILKNEIVLENKDNTKAPLSEVKMEGISVKSYLDNPESDGSVHQQILEEKLSFFQFNPKGGNSRVFLNMNETTDFWTAFVFTKDGYTGDDGSGIRLSDDLDKLVKVHGKPLRIFETTQGQIYSYPTNIYYLTDNKITRWITYGGKRGY